MMLTEIKIIIRISKKVGSHISLGPFFKRYCDCKGRYVGFHFYILLVPAALSAQNVRLQALDHVVYIDGFRAIERARLDLADDDVLRAGYDLIHDVIAVTFINQLADMGAGPPTHPRRRRPAIS